MIGFRGGDSPPFVEGEDSGAVPPRWSGSMALVEMLGIEHGLAFEHGAGDGEQAIGDGAQGPGVSVSALAQSGVLGPASGVVLHGNARPMVNGIAEPGVRGQAPDDDLALAGALGDRGDARQAPEGMVIATPQGIEGLCEQRGEDDPGPLPARMRGSSRRAAPGSAPARCLRLPRAVR